jgi:hypothetical protein
MWALVALTILANGTSVSRVVEVHSQKMDCETRMTELTGVSSRVTFTCAMRS